tara:strand:+ start:37202 stop:37834 length:633 start_codon:yes stop_codon:yes gene_type:complete
MSKKINNVRSKRADFYLIAGIVEPGSRVLDIGCGDGSLLELLEEKRNVDGRGIEISQKGVNASVARGLSVIQGDANTDLYDYPDDTFDYVILGQMLPVISKPREMLNELLRIGRYAVVSIPNAGYWKNRFHLLFRGRIPIAEKNDNRWWNTENIHPCTIRDFIFLCQEDGHIIEKGIKLDSKGRATRFSGTNGHANLFGEQAIFLLTRDK